MASLWHNLLILCIKHQVMLNDTEAGKLISQELPELNERFEKTPVQGLHKVMRALFDYTREKVDTYDLNAVGKCFSVVERLYENGDAAIRNAIENVYVFSLEK